MPLPESEAPGRLQAALTSRGLRLTHQRKTILGVVETAKQHLDAAQILRHARKIDPGIDRVTVYRTLKLLKRYGLVDELDLMHMQGEKHFYERRPQRDCRVHIVVTRLEVGGYCAQCRTGTPE
jgi:Fur family ferric uptake transcriptional regulator